MNIIPEKNYDAAMKLAEDLYDKECEVKHCPTPKEERVSRFNEVLVQNSETKEIAVVIPNELLPIVSVMDISVSSKLISIKLEDEIKWVKDTPETPIDTKVIDVKALE